MLENFALVLIFTVISAGFVFASLFAGRFFRPKNYNPVKAEIYECGEPSQGPAWVNFNIRFYVIALIFVIFDVEAALLFPVAAVFKKWVADGNGFFALFEVGLFVTILVMGLIYVWAKGDLEWVKNGDITSSTSGFRANHQDR